MHGGCANAESEEGTYSWYGVWNCTTYVVGFANLLLKGHLCKREKSHLIKSETNK